MGFAERSSAAPYALRYPRGLFTGSGSARLPRPERYPMSRIPVAIVGATGLAGQEFLASLGGHPMLQVVKVAASSRSAGKKLADAVRDDKGASRWYCTQPLPAEMADLVVEDSAAMT